MKELANPVDTESGVTLDYTNLETLFQPIEDFVGKLVALSDSAGSVGIESIKTLLDNIKTLFVSDTGTEYDTSSWLEGLDAESLATSITDFGNTVTGALMVVRDNLTTYSTDFSNAGKSLIAALNTGMTGSSSLAVSGIQTVLNAAHSAADSYRSKFVLVGWDICYGVRDGIRNGTSVVTSMAKSMAKQAYDAAKAELESNSPSKKFMELGEFSSEGFAIGIGNLSRVVEKSASGMGSGALDATKRSIASFASILSDDTTFGNTNIYASGIYYVWLEFWADTVADKYMSVYIKCTRGSNSLELAANTYTPNVVQAGTISGFFPLTSGDSIFFNVYQNCGKNITFRWRYGILRLKKT